MIDVLVVGGGPTGLIAAIEAARHGMRVVVCERRPAPVDKACGEGLMPGAVDVLGALGVDVPVRRELAGIRYVDGVDVAARFADGVGWGVRRTVLRRALLDRALALGVEVREAEVGEVAQDDGAVWAAGERARWLLAADGLRSGVRRQLGLDDPAFAARWPRRYGLRRHFAARPWSDHVEVWWADDVEAYVTPVADDLVGVAMLFGDGARDGRGSLWERLLARFPGLRERLVEPGPARGAGPFATGARARVAGRVLLVGDAAGYLDPLTGEGVRLGAIGAIAAVDAIRRGRPTDYEAAWRRQFVPYARATGALLRLTAVRPIRRRLVRILRQTPWIFEGVVRWLAR